MTAASESAPQARPLAGVHVVSVAVNLPGPAAVARLVDLGATATTVLPPAGDPLHAVQPDWFDDLHRGHELVTLDLKDPGARAWLDGRLATTDVLVTSSRPSALARLGLDEATLRPRFPRLCRVDVVGHAGADAERVGHDLTYQAEAGTVVPPNLPTTLHADLAGAERACAEAVAALLERERTGRGSRREVALADVAHALAEPARRGLTTPGGVLGGGYPAYAVYAAADGHVALAALEPHFWARTLHALGVEGTPQALAGAFAGRTTAEWEAWAAEHDVPLAAVRPAETRTAT
ncbi:CoA transferase [Thalassiella azotivora]